MLDAKEYQGIIDRVYTDVITETSRIPEIAFTSVIIEKALRSQDVVFIYNMRFQHNGKSGFFADASKTSIALPKYTSYHTKDNPYINNNAKPILCFSSSYKHIFQKRKEITENQSQIPKEFDNILNHKWSTDSFKDKALLNDSKILLRVAFIEYSNTLESKLNSMNISIVDFEDFKKYYQQFLPGININ